MPPCRGGTLRDSSLPDAGGSRAAEVRDAPGVGSAPSPISTARAVAPEPERAQPMAEPTAQGAGTPPPPLCDQSNLATLAPTHAPRAGTHAHAPHLLPMGLRLPCSGCGHARATPCRRGGSKRITRACADASLQLSDATLPVTLPSSVRCPTPVRARAIFLRFVGKENGGGGSLRGF